MNLVPSLLAAAVIGLTLAGSVHAVHLDPGGRGQALIYPYYTVNGQQQTLLSVTNTTSQPKVARLRFREGYNGRYVLEFNVWLSPYDVWTATVFALADAGLPGSGAALLSSDRSCTTPQLLAENGAINGQPYVSFSADQYSQRNADGGPSDLARTREGWMEIIAMADVEVGSPLARAFTHNAAGVPANCATVQDVSPEHASLLVPTGGLMGTASIINAPQGTLLAAPAEALAAFTAVKLFTAPGDAQPNLSSVNEGVPGQAVTAQIHDSRGRLQSLRFGGPGINGNPPTLPVDAVTALFMADRVINEYSVNAGLGARSEWVLTFPTKPFYTDPRWIGAGGATLSPFPLAFGSPGTAPVALTIKTMDRQGRPAAASSCAPNQLCDNPIAGYAVNVLSFVAAPDPDGGVLHSQLPVYPADPAFPVLRMAAAEGLANIGFGVPFLYSMEGKRLSGLPVIGFWASNLINNQVQGGVLSNYGATARHRSSVDCAAPDGIIYCD